MCLKIEAMTDQATKCLPPTVITLHCCQNDPQQTVVRCMDWSEILVGCFSV